MEQQTSIELGSFHELIGRLISRLYPKQGQRTRRTILSAYYSQLPGRRRSMTLEALGKVKGLKVPVSRERARQILSEFITIDLPKEVARLERGVEINDPIMVSNREDLASLMEIISAIVAEVETFEFPIYVDRIQARLKRLGLVDDKIFFPVVIDLSDSFSIEKSFEVAEYDGRRLVLAKGEYVREYTHEIITYARRIATHLGGVCSIDVLIDPSWDPKSPSSLNKIPESIREKFVIDLLETVDGVMLLQDKSFYAFRDREERVSSFLMPIFTAYRLVEKDRLFSAVIMGLKHRFMTKPNDRKREVELNVILDSKSSLDEYCRRTLLLDPCANDGRVPGKRLIEMMRSYDIGELYQAKVDMVAAIKRKGRPVSSKEFGQIYRHELKIGDSKKSHFYTYPTLFYKEGGGRMNDFYKTLDGLYGSNDPVNLKKDFTAYRKSLKELRDKIMKLQSEMEALEGDAIPSGQIRIEQGLLRQYLILCSDGVEMTTGNMSCKCLLCSRYFPPVLLVAAHVKKRSHCSAEEKSDIENVAMLQCGLCDKLFEYGFIYLSNDGEVMANHNAPMTDDVSDELVKLNGNLCEYVNGVPNRLSYVSYHRDQALAKYS